MKLIDHLETAGLSPEAAARARAAQDETGEPLPVVISRLGLLPDDAVTAALAGLMGWLKRISNPCRPNDWTSRCRPGFSNITAYCR